MRRIREKLNNKGFTLAELLIVVAIIAVLVAVSIPVFNGKLEKTREATDVANMRAAKAAAVTAYLSEELDKDETYYYDAESGTLGKDKKIVGYGKGTETYGGIQFLNYNGEKKSDVKGQIIEVKVIGEDDSAGKDLEVTLTWVKPE